MNEWNTIGESVSADYCRSLETHLAHLARLALAGRLQDVQLYLRRAARDIRSINPRLAAEFSRLLSSGATNATRKAVMPSATTIPVDHESRLQLARIEQPTAIDPPLLGRATREAVEAIVVEREREAELYSEDLHPTRTALFTGPPGVGKTLATKWIASVLNRPLVTLDLSAVMSSYLGKTGTNVRHVLDFAKERPCVLLLDEFDAIAKRRDDASEIGELKRLVTVLLQEIDDWPASGLLVAATNHSGLLDPAIWRRFETIVQFPLPDTELIHHAIARFLGSARGSTAMALAPLFSGLSFGEIERDLSSIRRSAVLSGRGVDETALEFLKLRMRRDMSREQRHTLASALRDSGLSQREVSELTGVSRDTLRKHAAAGEKNGR